MLILFGVFYWELFQGFFNCWPRRNGGRPFDLGGAEVREGAEEPVHPGRLRAHPGREGDPEALRELLEGAPPLARPARKLQEDVVVEVVPGDDREPPARHGGEEGWGRLGPGGGS